MTRILVVEDDRQIAEGLITSLERDGYECLHAPDGPAGLQIVRQGGADVMLLDLMIPGLDGISVCREVRLHSKMPILILTARDEESEKLLGLETGADDYITKPFSLAELKARIRAVLRRAGPGAGKPGSIVRCAGLSIDPEKRKVTLDGQQLDFKPTEFDLLYFLASHPGKVFTRSVLLDQIWKYSVEGYERTVDSHVTRIRRKLELDAASPQYLLTIHGVGYKFREPV